MEIEVIKSENGLKSSMRDVLPGHLVQTDDNVYAITGNVPSVAMLLSYTNGDLWCDQAQGYLDEPVTDLGKIKKITIEVEE
jgi:hypothetical protein